MISLPDRVKKDPQTLQDSLRLHYFPDIPLDQPADDGGRGASESGFQRIHFKNIDSTDSDTSRAPESEYMDQGEKGASIDDIKNAFQQGVTEGEKEGFEAGTKKIEPLINSLTQILQQLGNIRQEIHQSVEKEVVQLALSIAKKIVCHEVKTTPETVVCVAREALSRVENPGNIKIKMNPADLQFIKDTQSQLSHFLHDVETIRFEAEDSIQSGGCLIETDMGDIDARIEKQFQAIEESFQTEIGQPEQEN